MDHGQSTVIRILFLFLFAASVPVAISGVLNRNDLVFILGVGMGVIALFLRRFQKP